MTLFQANTSFLVASGEDIRKSENDTFILKAQLAFLGAASEIVKEAGEQVIVSDFRFIQASDKASKAIRKLADEFIYEGVPFALEIEFERSEDDYIDYYSVEVETGALDIAFHTYLKENGINLFERRLVIKDYPALNDFDVILEISEKLKKLVDDFRYHGLHVDCLEYMGNIEVWIV